MHYFFLLSIFASLFLWYLMTFTSIRNFFIVGNREFLTMGTHAQKKSPTSGGVVFACIALLSIFFFMSYECIFLVLLSLSSGMIGFLDDLYKIRYKRGFYAWPKFFIHLLVVLGILLLWKYYFPSIYSSTVCFGSYSWDLGWLYIPWALLVIIATSHAVNITDGIDGLLASQTNIILTFFLTFIASSSYFLPFHDHFVHSGVSSLLQGLNICIVVFVLIFNRFPSILFMGDAGAFFIGGLLSGLFLLYKIELFLIISGLVFVIETVSVIIQSLYYKMYKKRFFLFAPLHHHFEKKGYHETTIVKYAALLGVAAQCLMYFIMNCIK